jgi:hypothetical protein
MEAREDPPSSSSPSGSELLGRLRPGGSLKLGLLGPDEALEQVLERDAATLARLGLSYDLLADRLEEVQKAALRLFRRPVPPEEVEAVLARRTDFPNLSRPETVPRFDRDHLPDPQLGFLIGDLQVFVVSYKSWEYCPWGCNATTGSDFLILNRQTGESVTTPELMPHLVRAHHFFGGLESPYRTDPERLAIVLGLVG